MAKKYIAKKSENFSDWYTDVILKAELADYAPVKGCMVIRPYGYALWEGIQRYLGKLIDDSGVDNAYFPIFIPESYLRKEKEHVEGFSPETAVVTFAGGEELKEKMVVRPTSETIMYEMYKKWVRTYRDLPILINQWNNVVRWEKRTHLFLRTSEFLWQEGHCAHETHKESMERVLWALAAYQKTYQDLLSLYGIVGVKSESEKFAGAVKTYTYEMLMPDGKALQGCTSHDLGQNFAKAFDWQVVGKDQKMFYPWQNSWGLSTRSIGGLIMGHGDDDGLTFPPALAPIKLVIIPILGSKDKEVLGLAEKLRQELSEASSIFPGKVKLWGVDEKYQGKTFGWKVNQAELMGIPLAIPIGPKELASGKIVLSCRMEGMENKEAAVKEAAVIVEQTLKDLQLKLLEKHKKFTKDNTHEASNYEEFKKIMAGAKGFISAFWCENPECEAKIKEETKATTRCLPIDLKTGEPREENGKCVYCGAESTHRWLFAQAY